MRTYRQVISFLRERFPTDLPISVRRLRLAKNLDGDCQLKSGKYVIRINRGLRQHEAIETLLHEWAHAVAWDEDKDFHCKEWGIAYASIYRTFLKEFLEEAG